LLLLDNLLQLSQILDDESANPHPDFFPVRIERGHNLKSPRLKAGIRDQGSAQVTHAYHNRSLG
jgi:hypothetical protein